ncbi:MAG: phosphatidylethanolamine N-methyltransferase family protein, partial [Gemmatimonadota bacterium]|nr:phosphatidylethanolamine N-methyltransferase family protein [Gemmatimonadota bacterium]
MTTLETTAVPADIRSPEEINALLGRKSGVWRVIRAIRSNRPFLTAVLVVLAPVHALVTHAPVYDLVGSDRSWRFFLPWTLILLGVAIRLWGSGNLHKNQEITSTGAYRLVRHPLYVGSLAFFLAYFLT